MTMATDMDQQAARGQVDLGMCVSSTSYRSFNKLETNKLLFFSTSLRSWW